MIKIDWKRFWVEKPWREGTHFYYNMEIINDYCAFVPNWESVWVPDDALLHGMYAQGDRLVKKYQDLHT